MPKVGLGTRDMKDPEVIKKTVLEGGYRMVDTASGNNNEKEVGNAIQSIIKDGKLKRRDIYITAKAGFDEVQDLEASLKKSLEAL